MTTTSSAPRKKRSIGKIVAVILAALIVPLVIGYFVATSAFFLKKVILPSVSKSIGAEITVADASISPFSKVYLRKLKVQKRGAEPILEAEEVTARYRLMDIVRGHISVDELTVVSPVIQMIKTGEDHDNFPSDPETRKPSSPRSSGNKVPQLNILNVSLKNATILLIEKYADGKTTTAGFTNFNLKISQLKNGAIGSIELSSDILVQGTSDTSPSFDIYPLGALVGTNSSLKSLLSGKFDFALTKDLLPQNAKGSAKLTIGNGTGTYHDLSGLSAILNCDLTPSDIRQLSLHFDQAGQPLGQVRASGPFSFANMEGKLKLELLSIDRRVLNLAGASKGIDFNSTLINATNDLVLAQKGNSISVNGQLNVSRVSLTKKETKQTTPTMDLQMTYQLSVDQSAKSALIQSLDLNGTQNQQKILSASISKPMPISWGGASSTPENATLQLAIADLNLTDWKAFLSDASLAGKLNTTLNVISEQGGKQLSLSVTSRIDNFSSQTAVGLYPFVNGDIQVRANAKIAEMEKLALSDLSVQLGQRGQSALKLDSSGSFNLTTKEADLKTSLEGTLAPLLKIVVMPDVAASSGTLKFDGQITQRKEVKMVKGNFAVTDFSGSYAGSPLDRFGAKFDADLEMNQQDLQIRKLSGDLQQAGQPGGNLDVKGNYNSAKKTGNIELKIADLNQNALRPFLAKSLGEKQLVTISINGNTTALLQEDSSSFKGNIDLKNFVVRDPKKSQADAPLAAQLQIDGAMHKEAFDLKQFQVTLSPTQRAKNQLNITGQLDMSKTNALKGKLLVQSDAFDVTPFYDLYAAQPQPVNANATPTQTPQTSPAPSNQEPEPMKLPVDQIIAEINIGQFYLREMEIKDWRGTAKIEGSRVLLNPFQLNLNGAPVKMDADLNLGVKGYAYDFSASLNGVPLEPLANSFMPDKKGAYKGTIIANAKIKGAGTTGVNLKKTLSGQMSLNFTNANIQIVGPKFKKILVPIATVLQIPEIANSPIRWIDAKLDFADGKINIPSFAAVSDSYRGTVQGSVPIADVLTNSPLNKIPVGFELRKGLAEKARIAGATSADGNYVKLPNIILLTGTLGDFKTEFDPKGLATLTLQTGAGYIGGDAGKVLKGLGGILGGGQQTTPSTTNSINATTNQPPSQNQQLLNNALDLFKKKKK